MKAASDEVSKDKMALKAGAYIVAPVSSMVFIFNTMPYLFLASDIALLLQCPHDGPCPMHRTGKYCHFVQRLQRTSSQLTYKVPP